MPAVSSRKEGYTLYYASIRSWRRPSTAPASADPAKAAEWLLKSHPVQTVMGREWDKKGDLKVSDYVVYEWDDKGKYHQLP